MVRHGEMSLEELATRIRDRAGAPDGRYVLGIAGPPGAGKSTLATALRDTLNQQDGSAVAEVAPMDGFHLTNAALRAAGALARKGEPDTFDVAAYLDGLRKLRESPVGQPVPWPTYDRVRHEPVPDGVLFEDQRFAITEGNYLLLGDDGGTGWPEVREYLDEAWYLDAPADLLRRRLLRRHLRGGKSEEVARSKVARSDLLNADLVATTRDRADLVLRASGRSYLVL
ncbi:nucleoside/nucleotide kinase family protein [Nocardia blacklockiae]|uniref:nucleoside/nucleotide kinase family protein n=1 Tax=Nocardia blacklockiae TaxID=480036 RepID=UPI0018963481|nr:nucleoside/nucleotide kinase family protein [Nocardia blacklockiae]MBF6173208.1 nucleoside/nucleotide kinase family protein [Nocardia blacklockiae]